MAQLKRNVKADRRPLHLLDTIIGRTRRVLDFEAKRWIWQRNRTGCE
jgi:hypothetical protein